MVLILCSTIFIILGMTNNFYNVNISKYNPAEHNNAGQIPNANYQTQPPVQEGQIIQPQNNIQQEEANPYPSHERLNALDSTILINESYQNLDDEVFKKEYQIERLESAINSIDSEIKNAQAINDTQKVDVLVMRKHTMQQRLKELNNSYGDSDVTTKLSSNIAEFFNMKPTIITKAIDGCVDFVSEKILPKISKKYNSGRNIKTALNKLETLNKNVDELVTMQMPYGEADERYDMLSEYLNRANVIHFNISKTVGTPTFFDTISSINQEKFKEVRKNSSNFGNMTNRPAHHKMAPDSGEMT